MLINKKTSQKNVTVKAILFDIVNFWKCSLFDISL